jgi:ribosomal protein S18 acetylase RimI-like enzyme
VSELSFRDARARDLASIVAMLADDELGREREDVGALEEYSLALGQIEGDSRNRILVGEKDGKVVAYLQVTFINCLSRKGAMRALIEGVRVATPDRGSAIGEALVHHAIALAKDAGCRMVQLTSDKRRTRAHEFYRRLGFVNSHEGLKLEFAS